MKETVQLDLLGFVDPLGLTDRQRSAFDLLVLHRDGLTSEQIGAQLHFMRGKHPSYAPCNWCAGDGRAVLVQLRKRGLVRETRKPPRWLLSKDALRELPPEPMGDLPEGF